MRTGITTYNKNNISLQGKQEIFNTNRNWYQKIEI